MHEHEHDHEHEHCHAHDHDHDHAQEHCHAHAHAHTHPHTHDHPHADANAMTPEETLALLGYMLDHNRQHADELHDVCHALEHEGKDEAAAKLSEALHHFDHGNDALEEALKLAKGV